ncbi:CpsD/CapB family tyrosine-protein kinase [Paenibacillus aestuarii]|uniref:CpsD/CapB family tyrosine-protein kinase n=1 Tax=Paenibacillus aestuarii TaxID=516965 RepID=A0ABW0K083_9BACL|nr:CpsD/CapB family tyrosine-protein kinase [Paenibacillus aestuarii]
MPASTSRNYALITEVNPKSPISEAYRALRTNIQFSSVDDPVKVIVVTSAQPEEGKSTTISNLAVTYAAEGKKVLLLDADLRKPTLHRYLSESNRLGLSNYLSGKYAVEDVVLDTKIANLSLITSGSIPPNPSELLSSKKMSALITQLKEDFDMVLIDSPPVLAVTDAQILSNIVDGTVLVVNHGKVKRDAARKAISQLTHAKAKVLGVVLNNKEMSKKESSYYYYYAQKD